MRRLAPYQKRLLRTLAAQKSKAGAHERRRRKQFQKLNGAARKESAGKWIQWTPFRGRVPRLATNLSRFGTTHNWINF